MVAAFIPVAAMAPSIRPATLAEVPLLNELIAASAHALGAGFYTPEQSAALTREVFGVDTQLIRDGTYFAVERDGVVLACGGWSRRATPFGGDQAKRGADRLLDPGTEAARIRAFFVAPACARQGIGKALLDHCTAAAAAAGFTRLELTATMPGVPLYRAAGFAPLEPIELTLAGGVRVPLLRMGRALIPS
jgi:GNAT superfamily N-acetyltransferase